MPVVGTKSPSMRLTIPPRVIHSASSTFLFAIGKEKGVILAKALGSQKNIASLPLHVRYFEPNGFWILIHPHNSVMPQKNNLGN